MSDSIFPEKLQTMSNGIEQITFNVIGGAFVALLGWGYSKFKEKYINYTFKQIFGKDAGNNLAITYGKMALLPCFDEHGKQRKMPYRNKSPNIVFNVSSVVSFSHTKSIYYLSELFGRIVKTSPRLVSDEEIEEKLDISFCSIGGLNNLKTRDLLRSDENTFYDFGETESGMAIISKRDPTSMFGNDVAHDFGFIIKVTPKNFPNRVWIAVAGLGEWGTTGAMWFLVKNWKKMPKGRSFGMVVKVRGGQDESAEVMETLVAND